MALTERIGGHLRRLRHQIGHGPQLSNNSFQMAGYFPNRMASDILTHEPYMNGVIARAVAERPEGFWDVGANIGQTFLKVLAADPSAPYFGFEPQIMPAAQIQDFINRNQLTNCHIFPFALSDRSGHAWLYHNSDIDEMASVSDTNLEKAARRSTRILVQKGDDIFASLDCTGLGVLKIDAEGAEINVLRGFQRTISDHRPIILLEVLPNFAGVQRDWLPEAVRNAQERNADELLKILSEFGYHLQVVSGDGTVRPAERFNLNDRDGFAGVDYVARPRDRLS